MAEKRALIYDEFELHKVKYNSKTGMEIDYFEKGDRKDSVTVKSDTAPHPDLLNALKKLAPHAAYILGLQRGWDYSRENLKDDDELLKGATQGAKAADETFTVSGARLAGEGKNAGVKITGSLKCLTGATGMAIPLILFENTALGIEKTVQQICEEIEREVYLYLFSDKVAAKQEKLALEEGAEPGDTKAKKRKVRGVQTDLAVEAEKAEANLA